MPPRAKRFHLSPEYGEPPDSDPLLPWSYVDERLAAAMHYWISTVGPGGSPHARPIAGIWLDGVLYFGGSPRSRWFRNLRENPRATIHLSEEGDRAVILHGAVEALRPDRALGSRLAEASNAKYKYGQSGTDYDGIEIWAFHPRVAFAWKELNRDRTRFDWD